MIKDIIKDKMIPYNEELNLNVMLASNNKKTWNGHWCRTHCVNEAYA